jgi:hypothetical protein
MRKQVKAKTVRKKATLPYLDPIPVIVFPRKQAQYYNAESEELHGVSATDGLIPIEKENSRIDCLISKRRIVGSRD